MTFDFRKLKAYLLKMTLVMASILLFWVIYLDSLVRDEFKQSAWRVPATIFARPLSLAEGQSLSLEELREELRLLGYRQRIKAVNQGEYESYGNSLVIKLRDFQFWDGHQASKVIEVTIRQNQISRLKDFESGKRLNFLRLDPLVLGYINTGQTEDRKVIPLKKVPRSLIATLMLIEDREFYEHMGVSPKAILRAFWQNLKSGSVRQGGSTLTQQLMKNHFLTNKRSLPRKIQEALMALLTEWHYDKDTILEAYINEIYLGQNKDVSVHGFQRAAEFYFDRPLEKLDHAQIALLVALIKGPSYYNPRRHPERAKARRDLVLKLMWEHQIINESDYHYARSQKLTIVKTPPRQTGKIPALNQLLRRELSRDYSQQTLQSEGLRLFTSIHPLRQRRAERALSRVLEQLDPGNRKQLQGAFLSLDYQSGEIQSIVGDRDPEFRGFNRALDAYRQTGSVIKPFVYLAALERPQQFHLLTPIDDKELTLKGSDNSFWKPQNYDKKVHGQIPLMEALSQSYNLATARLALTLGMDQVVKKLRQLGYQDELMAYPSLALGAKEMSPWQVLQLYQVIANRGAAIPPSVILAVTDSQGQLLKRYPQVAEQVIEPEAAFLIQFALTRVMQEGTASAIGRQLGRRFAGKTGTTNDSRDSWFAGFGAQTLSVAWVGRDDNQPTHLSGASGAGKVWLAYYRQSREPGLALDAPSGVVWAVPERNWLSRLSDCKVEQMLPFYQDYLPEGFEVCDNPG